MLQPTPQANAELKMVFAAIGFLIFVTEFNHKTIWSGHSTQLNEWAYFHESMNTYRHFWGSW